MPEKYLIINPFPYARGNGVTSYVKNAEAHLKAMGVETHCISNDDHVHRTEFRKRIAALVPSRFNPDEWIIEAPEVGASTLLLPSAYRTHIRLHCPSAIVERYNSRSINRQSVADELDVVRNARAVSSPSYALLRKLHGALDGTPVHVFKNPPASKVSWIEPDARPYDIIFLGKFVALKGIRHLNRLLVRLPAHYRVCIIGRGASSFAFDGGVQCRLEVHDHIDGPSRLHRVGASRVCLTLSRFENCSMVILESLTRGTVVAGWDVGGHAEIASPPLLHLVKYGDVDGLVGALDGLRSAPYPNRDTFARAVDAVIGDFRAGWRHVWTTLSSRAEAPSFQGMDCAAAHAASATATATRSISLMQAL